MTRLSFLMLAVLIFGCVVDISCTADQAHNGQVWLQTPVTTQPGAPTHQQVITSTTDTVGGVTGPYGAIIAALVNTGLLLFNNYASRQRTRTTQNLVVASAPPDSPLAMGTPPTTKEVVTTTKLT